MYTHYTEQDLVACAPGTFKLKALEPLNDSFLQAAIARMKWLLQKLTGDNAYTLAPLWHHPAGLREHAVQSWPHLYAHNCPLSTYETSLAAAEQST